MIQAAIHPETKEFLGLIIPAADLKPGGMVAVHGSAEDWAAAVRGEKIPDGRIMVYHTQPGRGGATVTTVESGTPPEPVEVDNVQEGGQP